MARNGTVVTRGKNIKQILANPTLFQSFGAQVGDTGVTAKNNRKIIPAGTPVGGENSFYEDEKVILSVTNTAEKAEETQGVLLFDVDVTDGANNATVLVFGFVNEARLETGLVVATEAKKALDNKVTFVKRNA